jgi:hypothetical protein
MSTPLARNAEVAPGGGVWRSLRFTGVWNQAGFCVDAFGRNLASVAVKMFSNLIYFIKTFIHFVISVQVAKIML